MFVKIKNYFDIEQNLLIEFDRRWCLHHTIFGRVTKKLDGLINCLRNGTFLNNVFGCVVIRVGFLLVLVRYLCSSFFVMDFIYLSKKLKKNSFMHMN
jgi:hypothetical protein